MDECINVCAVETIDRCSQETKRVAVVLSDTQINTAKRMGKSQEDLIEQVCAQAGLDVLQQGKTESLLVSLRRGDTKERAGIRSADEVRCPLSFHPFVGGPSLLCSLYACDPFSTSCYAILAVAEAVLAEMEKEHPPCENFR